MKILRVVLCVSGCFCLTSYGATNYVDRTRPDDSGDGLSWTTAKRTIQAAVSAAAVNDTVLVAPGTYDEGMSVTPGGYLSNRVVVTKSIILQSRDGAAATVIPRSERLFRQRLRLRYKRHPLHLHDGGHAQGLHPNRWSHQSRREAKH